MKQLKTFLLLLLLTAGTTPVLAQDNTESDDGISLAFTIVGEAIEDGFNHSDGILIEWLDADGAYYDEYDLYLPQATDTLQLAIGFHADSIYLRGVYPKLPEAWVAGVVENDEYGAYVVLPRGQFMGRLADETPVYLLGSGRGGTTNDIYLDYDTLNAVLTTNATFVISTDRDAISIPATLGYYERGTFRPGTTGLHQIENGKLKVES